MSALKFNADVLEKFGLKNIKDKRDLVSYINDEIRNRVANTASERLKVLEARDNVLKFSK